MRVPIFLILLGIVLRGSSYVFRAYFTGSVRTQLYWGKVFSISSSITPLFLGIVIGAISSDAVLVKDGVSENGFLRTWFHPFPLIVGVLSLSLFAYLSACYLTIETDDPALQNDFRNRALFSGFVSLMAAFATYVVAGNAAHGIRDGLSRAPYVWLIEVGGGDRGARRVPSSLDKALSARPDSGRSAGSSHRIRLGYCTVSLSRPSRTHDC